MGHLHPASRQTDPTKTSVDFAAAMLVILNPHAGSMGSESPRRLLEDSLTRHQRSFRIHTLQPADQPDSLIALIQEEARRGMRAVIAVGGDGTVSLVAHAILQSGVNAECTLGIFPAGTANMLARELGIPTNWTEAAEFLCTCQTTCSLDAMQVGQRHHFLRIGVGLDADTIGQTPRSSKQRFGRWAYFGSLLQRLRKTRRHRFRCVVDGKKHKFHAVQVFLANGGGLTMAPFRLGPDIKLGDGIINVCAYDALSWWDYGRIIWRLLRGHFRRQPLMKFWPARHEIRVQTRQPVPVQADGEAIGHTPLQVRVAPSVLQVLAPSRPLRDA